MKQVLTEQSRKRIRADIYTDNKNLTYNGDAKIDYFVSRVQGRNVVDLGCIDHDPENSRSIFWLHGHIKSSAARVVGIDYYQKGVKYFEDTVYDIRYGDAQNFNLNEKFDVVTAGDLIEHLPNPGSMFECANNHLEIGGSLVISTPNPWCWKYVLYYLFFGHMKRINREHVAWFCPTTLDYLAQRYGFQKAEHNICSRRWWEKIVPVPARLRHTTINITFLKKNSV